MDENTGIVGAAAAPGRGEWDVDAAEIMEGVRDEDEAAPEGETVQPDAGGFRLKHLDAEYTVDRDKVVELAQKGLDYDRVRSKLETAREELAGLKAEAERAGVDVTERIVGVFLIQPVIFIKYRYTRCFDRWNTSEKIP